MPSLLSPAPSPPPLATLQFESQPAGAEVRTSQGQTCETPCSLAVPSEGQAVTFSKPGFLPQTIDVAVGPVPDHSFFESAPPPSLTPNPVVASLQPAGPPPRRRPVKPRLRRTTSRVPAQPPPSFPPPQQQQPSGASPFPPPPGQQQQ